MSALNIERLRNAYQEVINIYRNCLIFLLSRCSTARNDKKSISTIKTERDFIKLVRKLENRVWLDPEDSKDQNGIKADALKNFKTSTNTLSVFIADDEEKISRILAAIAAGADKIDRVDYSIFDTDILDQYGIKYEKCLGETPDEVVNQLHVDLRDLTASQVCLLAQDIQSNSSLERLSKKDVEKAIYNGLDNNFLKRELVRVKHTHASNA
jgi:hypothetical protein